MSDETRYEPNGTDWNQRKIEHNIAVAADDPEPWWAKSESASKKFQEYLNRISGIVLPAPSAEQFAAKDPYVKAWRESSIHYLHAITCLTNSPPHHVLFTPNPLPDGTWYCLHCGLTEDFQVIEEKP